MPLDAAEPPKSPLEHIPPIRRIRAGLPPGQLFLPTLGRAALSAAVHLGKERRAEKTSATRPMVGMRSIWVTETDGIDGVVLDRGQTLPLWMSPL